MVGVMRLLYRALGHGRGIALGSRSNSDWDGAGLAPDHAPAGPATARPRAARSSRKLGVYAIGFFVLPLGREPIAMLEQRHRVRACLRARKRSGRSGWPHALYPPGRLRGLPGLRADLSGDGDLLRGRRAG